MGFVKGCGVFLFDVELHSNYIGDDLYILAGLLNFKVSELILQFSSL